MSSFSSNIMTSSGRVAPLGHFGGAEVLNVRPGEQTPEIIILHGNPGFRGSVVIGRCEAKQGARIEDLAACPNGIYLEVLGDPHSIEVKVWHG
jgi:hypothetical protein